MGWERFAQMDGHSHSKSSFESQGHSTGAGRYNGDMFSDVARNTSETQRTHTLLWTPENHLNVSIFKYTCKSSPNKAWNQSSARSLKVWFCWSHFLPGVTILPASPSLLLWTSQMITNHFHRITYSFWLVYKLNFLIVTESHAATAPIKLLQGSLGAHSKYNTCILASCHHRIYPNLFWEFSPQKPLRDFHYHTS